MRGRLYWSDAQHERDRKINAIFHRYDGDRPDARGAIIGRLDEGGREVEYNLMISDDAAPEPPELPEEFRSEHCHSKRDGDFFSAGLLCVAPGKIRKE